MWSRGSGSAWAYVQKFRVLMRISRAAAAQNLQGLRSEGLDGERGHHGGVDAAGQAEKGVGAAVLAHVVSDAEDESVVDVSVSGVGSGS